MESMKYPGIVRLWLLVGVIMVCVQIILGGITRLTGSGLSITKWEIVTGTLPPLKSAEWTEEFEKYRATPQYQKINRGMTMPEFKFIYWWEYVHRLWARMIGIVFVIPFVIFQWRRMLDKAIVRRLLQLVALGMLVALFGWIMVASGLNERPWVNAYKLTLHLNLGLLLFACVLWVYLYSRDPLRNAFVSVRLRRTLSIVLLLLVVQLLLGGIMSGMKAGLYYPTWPDMHGSFAPAVLFDTHAWTVESFVHYDARPLAPALIQFMHRLFAYSVFAAAVIFLVQVYRVDGYRRIRKMGYLLTGAVSLQIVLGILTVIHCIGELPLVWGVLHQTGAIIVLSIVIYLLYYIRSE